FLRKLTTRAIKVTLPSPYVILRRFYSPEHSAKVYPTREHFLYAVEEVLLEEAGDILAAGADCIQLDDPMLCYFVDAQYCGPRSGNWGSGRCAAAAGELHLGVASVNRLARPLKERGAYVVLHVCRGNIERPSDAQGDFQTIWPDLCRVETDELALEFAMPQAGSIHVLANFPQHFRLGIGSVARRSPEIDSADNIIPPPPS